MKNVIFYLLLLTSPAHGSTFAAWEASLQFYTDSLKLKTSSSAEVPLVARAFGLFAGYGVCHKFFGRACLYTSAGLGLSSALVESESSNYIYKDKSVLAYQLLGSGGLKHYFKGSRATASVTIDLEGRQASYRSPGNGYRLSDPNFTLHYWLRTQFDIPITNKHSFTQSLLFGPVGTEFAYRLGLTF